MENKSSCHNKKYIHTFAICAYGESPYLEDCIRSLKAQRLPARILIATSTPNVHIESLAEKYGLSVHINKGEKGLAGDWNFALGCARTPLVTLAHQDDCYYPDFTLRVRQALRGCSHPLIVFTDYNELRNDRPVTANRLLRIKRLMLFPLYCKAMQKSRFMRRRILSVGNPVCCPSVTFVKPNLKDFSFRNNMKSNIDWQAWEELSRKKGEFVYVPRPCMEHRIHEDSTTSGLLRENGRQREDLEILKKFWPVPIARLIEHFYSRSEESNRLKQKILEKT